MGGVAVGMNVRVSVGRSEMSASRHDLEECEWIGEKEVPAGEE